MDSTTQYIAHLYEDSYDYYCECEIITTYRQPPYIQNIKILSYNVLMACSSATGIESVNWC